MYYLAEINFVFLFIALAGSITVDFEGYFDFNRKWTYTYQVLRSTTEISKSDVRKQGRMTMTDTDKEISNDKSKIELKTTHKTRFSVTGHFEKVANKDSTTKKKKRQKNLRQETTTFSDEDLEQNIEDVTESDLTSLPIDTEDKKPITSGKISMNHEVGAAKTKKNPIKGLQQDVMTFADETFEINSQESITESVSTSPSIGRGVKKPAATSQMNRSLEDYDTPTEKKKRQKDLQHDTSIFSDENVETNSHESITENVSTSSSINLDVKKPAVTNEMSKSFEDYDTTTENKKHQKDLQHDMVFSDENLETNSQESITESVLTTPSIGRGAKKPVVTNQMSKSIEDYDTTTEKKKHQKDQQHDIMFSDENFETNSKESITESILTSPSIGRNAKKSAMTDQMSRSSEDYDTTTKKIKRQKGQQHDITTFSDENTETKSQKHITESVLTSPSISRGAKKPAATSQTSINLEEGDTTIIKKKHHKTQRHDMTTSSDEYSDQENATGSDLKTPSKDADIEKSTTGGTTNISVEDETTTKNKKRNKKPKKTSKKIVYEPSSDSQQDSDMYSLEDDITTPKKNQARSKESQSSEKNLDTTTENIFNTMRPQYFLEASNVSLHTIEEDPQVKYFIGHILRSALRIFSNLKNKSKSPDLAAKIDLLADKYVTRYNLFIDEIKKNKIKTTLGPQKVLLSAIDSSDHMMNRIVNYIVEDGSNKDSLRTSINVANEFKQAINKETEDKYKYICRMMNVCHSKSGFANFLNEYITIILLCDESKFAEAVKAFTEVTKKINFNGTFDTAARLNILRAIKYIENQNLQALNTILKIIRNIIAYKNEPLKILKSDRAINSTLAILEILEAFETKLLRSDANIIIWGDLRANLIGWAHHKRTDVHDTMNNFMFYLKTALDDMPSFVKKRIAHNIGVIMNRKPGM